MTETLGNGRERDIHAEKLGRVEFYNRFQNAGYRGMYEMDYQALRQMRGITDPKRTLLDFMGKDELAGNLFRLTLTEGRIKMKNVRGQDSLEEVARQVGKTVRDTMIEQTGVRPEDLPVAQDIRIVKKGLKSAKAGFSELDDIASQRLVEARTMAEIMPVQSDDAVQGCPECAAGNPATHNGSVNCTSGSIASGGAVAHCTCDYCY